MPERERSRISVEMFLGSEVEFAAEFKKFVFVIFSNHSSIHQGRYITAAKKNCNILMSCGNASTRLNYLVL